MRITQENFKESLDHLQSKDGKDRVYYKLVSFKTQTSFKAINFKLAPNVLVAILAFFCLCSICVLFTVTLLKINLVGPIYIIFVLIIAYISYAISVTVTEKLFRNQILEFTKLINTWKKESK